MPQPDGGSPAVPEVYVQPGESHVVSEPVILRTLLGSCVGVTFWVPRLGLGAICHPMLPVCPPAIASNRAEARRYVDFAIREIASDLARRGARMGEVQTKLFGGGDVLLVSDSVSRPTVGSLNCEAALTALRSEGIDIVASSLRGTSGLNIQFHTGTGEVLLRRLGGGGAARSTRECPTGL